MTCVNVGTCLFLRLYVVVETGAADPLKALEASFDFWMFNDLRCTYLETLY